MDPCWPQTCIRGDPASFRVPDVMSPEPAKSDPTFGPQRPAKPSLVCLLMRCLPQPISTYKASLCNLLIHLKNTREIPHAGIDLVYNDSTCMQSSMHVSQWEINQITDVYLRIFPGRVWSESNRVSFRDLSVPLIAWWLVDQCVCTQSTDNEIRRDIEPSWCRGLKRRPAAARHAMEKPRRVWGRRYGSIVIMAGRKK